MPVQRAVLFVCIAVAALAQEYGVVLTTIPPRFSSVYHAIDSWLDQSLPPAKIVLVIPLSYERYDAVDILQVEEILHRHSLDDSVDILHLEKDWGPASKYVGLLSAHSKYKEVDYWIVGDDDVRYSSDTISRYAAVLAKFSSEQIKRSAFTHFAVEPRVHYLAPDKSTQHILHVQGVDTVLFPSLALATVESESTMSMAGLTRLLAFFHNKCPASFFQDDYLISLALHLANITSYSLWNGSKVANHVNGVSTSFEQMHLHTQVMRREEVTKECIEHAMRFFYEYVKYGHFSETCEMQHHNGEV